MSNCSSPASQTYDRTTHRSTTHAQTRARCPTSTPQMKEMQLQDMLPMLPKVHRGCSHSILTPSTQDCTSHASASHAANDPPFATWQPPNRYEKCRRIFDLLRGNAEGAAGEVEASLKPATRAQTGGQDQGPPSPGASRRAGAGSQWQK